MNFGSVCSGIEAASISWHPLGWKASWLAEIAKFPSAVLAHHYPDVSNLGDMTTIAARVATGEVSAPDVLVGGTPCQAFSVAGLRGGLSDARGQLTLSFVELAHAIDAARSARREQPAIIVWENVPGVLSSKDNAFGCFLGGLAGEECELKPAGRKWSNAGCVFGPQRTVAWRILDAQYFGVAQRRRRVFVVASARNGFDPTEVLFEFDGVRRDTAPSREAREDVAGTVTSSLGRRGGQPDCGSTPGFLQPIAYGGNNTSGSIDVATARNACASASASASASGRLDFETETFIVEQPVLAFSAKDYGNDVQVELAPTLRAGGHTTSHANAGVMPAIAFNARQDPDTWTERTGPLDTDGCTQAAMVDMSVRRLTPRECERLQGFPDDYTLIPFGKTIRPEKLNADWIKYLMRGGRMTREECARAAADGPRYKALGNSMAVPCMRWIGERIARLVRASEAA